MIRSLVHWLGPQSPLGIFAGFLTGVLGIVVVMPPLIWATTWLWRWTLGPLFGWWWHLWLPGLH